MKVLTKDEVKKRLEPLFANKALELVVLFGSSAEVCRRRQIADDESSIPSTSAYQQFHRPVMLADST